MSCTGSLLTEVLCCSLPAEGILAGQCSSQHVNLRDTHTPQPAVTYVVEISGPVPQLEAGGLRFRVFSSTCRSQASLATGDRSLS